MKKNTKITIKHINKPNDSFNKEDDTSEKPIQIGIQGAYEFDINPFERRYLPRYSYLMVYLNAIKIQKTRLYEMHSSTYHDSWQARNR